jgi:hypothetical protein
VRVLVLGAGSSIATMDFPGTCGFGRALKREWGSWRVDCPTLSAVVSQTTGSTTDDWNLDDVWTRLDYLAKLAPALGVLPYGHMASVELHAAIVAVLGRGAAWDELGDCRTPGSLPALLSELDEGDSLVSFNWDTAAENILGHQLRPRSIRLVQAASPSPLSGVYLAKPHGSLSWHQASPGEISEADGSPRLAVIKRDDVLCRRQHPVILGAVPMKSELIAEVQAGPNVWIYRCIMSQWQHLCDALSRTDELCVAGYGFPAEDTHGRFLFQEAARRRRKPWGRLRLYAAEGEQGERARERMASALQVAPREIVPEGEVQKP